MGRKPYPSDMTDAEWEIIRSALPEQTGRGRRRTVDLREVLNAIFYLVRTSTQWRYLPHDFPPWQTVRYYSQSEKELNRERAYCPYTCGDTCATVRFFF